MVKQVQAQDSSEGQLDPDDPPRAHPFGTVLMLAGMGATAMTLDGETSADLARHATFGVGISIAISVMMDWWYGGFRNLIRADLMSIAALFFLTLFEFIYPQPEFNNLVPPVRVPGGLYAVMWGFAGIAVGRHLVSYRSKPFQRVFTQEIAPGYIIALFWIAMVVGYLHMLIPEKIGFNPMKVFEYWLEPRFIQPWGRGKFGNWKALLNELSLLLYLIPPLAGVVFARRERYGFFNLIMVAAGLTITLFYGFSTGTRNIFASFLVTLMIGYLFSVKKHQAKQVIIIGAACALIMLMATRVMLEFRPIGLKRYLFEEQIEKKETVEESLFVDYNLFVICHLVHLFPNTYKYLEWEVPYLAIVRPIPRAIWKGKPEGLSTSIEDALGVEGLTLASSFVGEAYISFGNGGVFFFGCFFGMLAGWWSHTASSKNSDLGVLIYASGFFAAVISMRSLFVFTTALLPTMAAIFLAGMIIDNLERPPRPGPRGPNGPKGPRGPRNNIGGPLPSNSGYPTNPQPPTSENLPPYPQIPQNPGPPHQQQPPQFPQ